MLSRNVTSKIHFVLDHIVPPFLRDSKLVMYPIIRMAYGPKTKLIMEFKEHYPFLTDKEISRYYAEIKDVPVNKRETDLNSKCRHFILDNIKGKTVIDVACGRGALLKAVAEKYPKATLHGTDIVCPRIDIPCTEAPIENLPFADKSFDTVLCTHVLEHVREHRRALKEIMRITKRRLIIVVPKQREYRYTTDLHVNFFPYMYRFQSFIGVKKAKYYKLGGDFLCVIDF